MIKKSKKTAVKTKLQSKARTQKPQPKAVQLDRKVFRYGLGTITKVTLNQPTQLKAGAWYCPSTNSFTCSPT